MVTGGVSLQVRTCTPRFCISETARPIVFKVGVWVWGHYLSALPKSWMGCIRTCARAQPFSHKCFVFYYSVTAGPIVLKLVCNWGSISCSTCSKHGRGTSARVHVHTALLYLRNGLADCIQIWCVGWGSLPKCFPQVMGGVHPHVRTCAPLFCISRTD